MSWRIECGAGNLWKSSDGSNGMRLIWQRLPIVQAKSAAAISAPSRIAKLTPLSGSLADADAREIHRAV